MGPCIVDGEAWSWGHPACLPGLLPVVVQLAASQAESSWTSFHAIACLFYYKDVPQLCSRFFTSNVKEEYLAAGEVISRGCSKEFVILYFCYSQYSIRTKLNYSFSWYLILTVSW